MHVTRWIVHRAFASNAHARFPIVSVSYSLAHSDKARSCRNIFPLRESNNTHVKCHLRLGFFFANFKVWFPLKSSRRAPSLEIHFQRKSCARLTNTIGQQTATGKQIHETKDCQEATIFTPFPFDCFSSNLAPRKCIRTFLSKTPAGCTISHFSRCESSALWKLFSSKY